LPPPGADMVFITAGEGGGHGTGAAARDRRDDKNEIGAMTVGVRNAPSTSEARMAVRQATRESRRLERSSKR